MEGWSTDGFCFRLSEKDSLKWIDFWTSIPILCLDDSYDSYVGGEEIDESMWFLTKF